MKTKLDISVVIGTFQRRKFLRNAINTICKDLKEQKYKYEIIIIDGGSSDGTIRWLVKQKDIISIIQHNRGNWKGKQIERKSWGYFMNLGFKCAIGKYVCMLSDDCLVIPGAITNGIKYFEKLLNSGRNVGALAFYFRNWPEDKKYFVNIEFGRMYVNHGLYLKEALQKVDYIDEGYTFYNADIDLCLKLDKAGFMTVDSEGSFIEHFSHAGMKIRKSNKSQRDLDNQRLLSRWAELNNDKIIKEGIFRYSEYKEFSDTHKTYKEFYSVCFFLSLWLHKVKRKIFKPKP